MLLISAILFTGICVLVAFFAVLGSRSTRRKAAVRSTVDAQIKSVVEKAEQLDVDLARWMVEGKPAAESIGRWQQERQAMLTTSRTKHPWAWSEEELRSNRAQKIRDLSQRVTQQAMMHMALGVAIIIFIFGGATLVAYARYAHEGQQLGAFEGDESSAWQSSLAADGWDVPDSQWPSGLGQSPDWPDAGGDDSNPTGADDPSISLPPADAGEGTPAQPEAAAPPQSNDARTPNWSPEKVADE